MSSSLNRVGRALIKYFKPARVANPHFPGERHNPNPGSKEQNSKDYNLLELKRPKKDPVAESKKLIHTSVPAWEDSHSASENLPDLPQTTDQTPSSWLNLVLGLFKACKKAGDKVRKKMGFRQYETQVQSAGKEKLKTIGSIVNTTAEEIEMKPKANSTINIKAS